MNAEDSVNHLKWMKLADRTRHILYGLIGVGAVGASIAVLFGRQDDSLGLKIGGSIVLAIMAMVAIVFPISFVLHGLAMRERRRQIADEKQQYLNDLVNSIQVDTPEHLTRKTDSVRFDAPS